MGSSIPIVVAWIFVAIFAATGVIVLLDMVKLITIREAGQRKWLFRTLLGSIVVAIAGLGTSVIRDMDSDARPTGPGKNSGTEANSRSTAPADGKARKAPEGDGGKGPAVPPDGADRAADGGASPSGAPADPEVAAWALANLGPRPGIPAAFDRQYPGCVAELQRLSFDAVDPADASTCRNQLDLHHIRYIVGFYGLKEPYDRALRSQEAALRRGGIAESERAFYNYVVSENEDLNDPGGPTLQRIEDAETRIRADIRLCRMRRCRKEA